MPKKSTNTRPGAQRNKPRTQKSFELVRPVTEEEQIGVVPEPAEPIIASTTPAPTASATAKTARAAERTTRSKTAVAAAPEPTPIVQENEEELAAVPRASAATRIAARRQASQKVQQRAAASLITAEHFTYVRRDLITIAILAAIMIIAILALYFTLGRL